MLPIVYAIMQVAKRKLMTEEKASVKKAKKPATKTKKNTSKQTKTTKTIKKTKAKETAKKTAPSDSKDIIAKEWKHGTLDRTMEDSVMERGFKVVVGVDEAGRG